MSASTAVIQVKRGIGDVIWHLPFARAIAAVSPGGKVAFLAPPSTGAKDLLAAEPAIAEVLYFEHSGNEFRRALNLIRLVALLRDKRFRTLWILDRTNRPAFAAFLAGIPDRIGLGLGSQKLFITNAGIDRSHFHDHPIDWLRALMTAMNVPFASTEPGLAVSPASLDAMRTRFAICPRPWSVVAVGAYDPVRDWPESCWTEFISKLRRSSDGTTFLIGGPANAARAQKLIEETTGAAAINACTLSLADVLALLRLADLFVGTDSGPLNLAAAVGTAAFGLFGVNRVLDYSKFIHAIVPPDGPSPGGMAQIAPAAVLERIGPYLSASMPRTGDASPA